MHLVRHYLNFCEWKDRKTVAKHLERIYQATDDIEADKARGSSSTDDAAMNLNYAAIRSCEKTGRAAKERVAARNPFPILYPEQFNA